MSISRNQDFEKANIEIVNSAIQGCRFTCAVFDFDGTISLLREQWPEVMSQVMVEMICGQSEPLPSIQQEVKQYVKESAGLSTIEQMRHLVTLVKKYGLVPVREIRTAEAYKEIYDRRLLKVVDEQLTQLKHNRLTDQVLIVPGAIEFLDGLKSFGVVLYVASTTDRQYLWPEAKALGVTHYFQEIYGPDPTLPGYSKDWLVRQVLEWHDLSPDQLLVVGDGQVEISVAKKHGAFALGVASTEKPSGVFNPTKRQMLLAAGADMIVPDFSHYRLLTNYLFEVKV